MLRKTKYYSYATKLPKGCQLCVKGLKTVLFITGLCSRKCFYCPISDQKKNKDVVYVNEWPTTSLKELVKEIKLCNSKGVGITGGDPLVKINRTIKYIKFLKKTFGKSFHVHLYTPLNLVNAQNLNKLHKSGLDEIRFHPDFDNKQEWHKLILAKKYPWRIGVEIPAIPRYEKKTKALISFLKGKVDFINLNELEISETNANKVLEKGYKVKDELSFGVYGSEQLALKLAKYCDKLNLPVHYCTAKLKDKIQLANRIKKRAKNAKKPFDYVTKEGMLVRGAVYSKNLKKIYSMLAKYYRVPEHLLEIDYKRKRILTSVDVVYKLKKELKKLKAKPMIVEEYPTWDCFCVEAKAV